MTLFLSVIKAIHLLALVFGSAASLGNIYIGLAKGPHDLAAPGYTNTLRKAYRFTSLIAIIALWASGIFLLLMHGGWVPGFAFSAKLTLVAVMTCIIFFMNLMAPSWARNGGPPSYVPILSWINAVSLLLIVTLAAFAFG